MPVLISTRLNTRQKIGAALLRWHRSSGCPIYVLGSNWLAGKTVSKEDGDKCYYDLINLLAHLKLDPSYTAKDCREVEKLIVRVQKQSELDYPSDPLSVKDLRRLLKGVDGTLKVYFASENTGYVGIVKVDANLICFSLQTDDETAGTLRKTK